MTALSPRLQMLLTHARRRPTDEAAELLLADLGSGGSPAEAVRRLAETVQAEIGRCWQENTISAVEEHLATVVVEQALISLERTHRGSVPPSPGRRVVLACPEGEAHTLASRMAGLLLRWDGWETIALGGPAPADDLRDWLLEARPDAVAVTCVTSLGLRGVPDVAEAARAAGVPCVCGGGGFGPDGRYAAPLGVRWAPDPESIEAALARPEPASDGLAERARRCDDLSQIIQTTVAAGCIRLGLDLPALAVHTEREWAQTRSDLTLILRYLAAALLTGLDEPFRDLVAWMQVATTSRGLPADLLTHELQALHGVLPRTHGEARAVLEQAISDSAG